jgi:hypothetical protein
MTDRDHRTPYDVRISRRSLLKGAAGVGAAAGVGGILGARPAFAGLLGSRSPATPLDHIVISCQENRSSPPTGRPLRKRSR